MDSFPCEKMRRFLWWTLKAVVTLGILLYLFSFIPAEKVFRALSEAHAGFFATAVILQFIMRFVGAAQMHVFTERQKMGIGTAEIAKINFVSQFYGIFLPGELTASIIKWYKFSAKDGKRAQAAASILFSRLVNVISLAFIGIAAFFIERPAVSQSVRITLISAALLFIFIYTVIAGRRLDCIIERVVRPASINLLPAFINEKLAKAWKSLKLFRKLPPHSIHGVFALSIIYNILGTISAYLIMQSIGVDMTLIAVAWIRAAAIFIQMVPLTISGLGVREGALVFFLGTYGVSNTDAMAVSLLIFSVILSISLAGGVIELKEFYSLKGAPKPLRPPKQKGRPGREEGCCN